MNRPRRDGASERELERQRRQERLRPPGQSGAFSGHEGSVGSTAQGFKRSKRSR